MSLVARKILNGLRTQQHFKYNTLANKVGLPSICDNRIINNSQYELLKLNTSKSNINRFTLSTTFVHYSYKESFYNFYKYFDVISATRALGAGFHWFSTIDSLNYEDFFKLLGMPDTFYTWFKITELHVWMVLVKIANEGNVHKFKRNSVIEAMWKDAEKRAKVLNIPGKQMKTDFTNLYHRFKASLLIYDEGFLSNDRDFASALWHQFFDQKCDDPRILEALVSYCRAQVPHLLTIDIGSKGVPEDIKIWLPLKPHFKYLS